MRKLYVLLLLCCLGYYGRAQSVSVVLWANAASNSTGYSNSAAITYGNIITGNSNTDAGYAVFNLNSIPAGAVIMSVSSGIDVTGYAAGGGPAPTQWNTYGYYQDFSTIASAPSLFLAMTGGGGQLLYNTSWGTAPGDPEFPSPGYLGDAVSFVTAGLGFGNISLAYLTTAAPPVAPYTSATYTITGLAGLAGAAGDTAIPGHAPYLSVTYCPQPTAVAATGPTSVVCAGTPISFTGSASGATNYIWTGPGGFTSTDQNPTIASSGASSGIYTLTAVNTCGSYSATATATTSTVSVDGGAISGVTNFWTGFTDSLSDPTPGGTWTTGNPAIATFVAPGIDSGVSAGTVTATYTTGLGCSYTTSLLVEQSVFAQIPTVAGGSGGLGFPIQAWYPFCGDTVDRAQYVGAGPYPLINIGSGDVPATLTSDRFGLDENAYAFAGQSVMYTNTYFTVSSITHDFFYSCWFEADTAQNSIIIYNGNPATDGFGFVMNNGAYPFGTGPGNYVSVLMGGIQQYLPTQVSLNRWHSLMLVENGHSFDFYIDDISVGFFVVTYNDMSTGSVFSVGGDGSSIAANGAPVGSPLQYGFYGKIDDISVYNQQISVQEMDSLYNFNPDSRLFLINGNGTGDTSICTDSTSLYPLPGTLGNYYLWTKWTPGSSIDTFSYDSLTTVYPSASVLYNSYALQAGKPFGCIQADTLVVYRNAIPISLGSSSISMCLGDTVTLADLIPHSSSSYFTWSNGDTANSIRVWSAGTYSVTIDSVDHYTTYIGGVAHEDSITCVGFDSIVVQTYSVPTIGISNYTNCQGVPDTIRPFVDTNYTYYWGNLGLGPIYGTASVDTLVDGAIGLNTYWLEVTNTGCNGCQTTGCSVFDTISVFIAFDTLTFYAHDTAVCAGATINPTSPGSQLLVTDNHIATYQWTPTTGMPVSNTPNPTITPDTSTEYILTVSYAHCPTLTDSFYLDVQPNPVVFPGNNRSVCQFDSIHVIANVTPAWYTHYNYFWSPSTELNSATTSTVVFDPSDTGLVNLIIAVSTPAGCADTDSVQLYVHPGNFILDSFMHTVCPNESLQLTPFANLNNAPGTVITGFSWSPSTYLSDSTSPDPWVNAVTSINYQLIATSQYGCTDTVNYQVTVTPAAVLNMPDSVNIQQAGASYQISPQTNCVNFVWYPSLQINDIYASAPVVDPEVNTTYIVHASTEDGCPIVDSIKIRINPAISMTAPNAFTPGAGTNNIFYIICPGCAEGTVTLQYFRIFNRWGNQVFSTTNINDGWDGTYEGKPQPFDVYVYEFEATTNDGTVFRRQGNVTLLR